MAEQKESYPDPDELLPHSGDMNLLNDLVEHTREYTTCRFRVNSDHVFFRDGRVPTWFGIEFMGQCSFYHFQLNRHEDEEDANLNALFLGGRNLSIREHQFRTDIPYIVYAKDFGMNNQFFAAETYIYPENNPSRRIIAGRLSALILDPDESILQQRLASFS